MYIALSGLARKAVILTAMPDLSLANRDRTIADLTPAVITRLPLRCAYVIEFVEHRMGFEPMNTGFADQRVNHFAIGASRATSVSRCLPYFIG
jgi:hypothetical protein